MAKINKTYTEEFKKMIIELQKSGKKVSEIASEYGVDRRLIYQWIKKYTEVNLDDGTTITNEDYRKIQKQLKQLQEENEILKKAVAIFTKK